MKWSVIGSMILGWACLGTATPVLAEPPQVPPQMQGEIVEAAKPPPPEQQREMDAWHRRYQAEMQPVTRSLAELVEVAGGEEPRRVRPACQVLGRDLVESRPARFLPVPDYAADRHLREAIAALNEAAAACMTGRVAQMRHQLARMRGAFRHAELALRRFGLAP